VIFMNIAAARPLSPASSPPSPTEKPHLAPPKIIIFDLGGVLLDWDPRYLYRKIFSDEEKMTWFLTHVCMSSWNIEQDRGRDWPTAIASQTAIFPEWAEEIAAYRARWPEMVQGAHMESVAILAALKARHYPLYALTNFAADTLRLCDERFDFLAWFNGRIVSGEVGQLKPDLAIYQTLLTAYQLDPQECVFIDDNPINASAPSVLGMRGIHFTNAQNLRQSLKNLGVELEE
jgi:2-haloacid dehalogenase